jgi:hypothetical protein
MSENTKNQVREFYDQIGWSQVGEGIYQNARYEDLRPVSREYIHKCHLRVKEHIAPAGDLLLDAGSGPVQYPEYVAYSENYKHRVCADISITALKEARHRLGDHGLYVVMDVANLPFKSDAFDAVVSLHTIHHLPLSEHRNAYIDLIRVLKPGRTAAIVNGWHSPRLMTMTEPLIRFARLLAGRGRKHKKAWADVDDPTGTFVSKMTPDWLKQELGGVLDYEILPWRSLSTRFLRWFIRPSLGGRAFLRFVFWLEDRFPRYFGENGQYPLIVFHKRGLNATVTQTVKRAAASESIPALPREESAPVDRVLQTGVGMEANFDFPKSASQWFKLRKNRRLFFWWLFHRVTSPLRVLPNFIIVGTMKGGTTSMFQYLAQHPRVNPPFRKEIKFFDIHYPKGLMWYRAHYPLFAKMTDGALTGEATPYYIFHPLAAQRLAETLPNVKLIFMLRNPVDRAYSHYSHINRVGREPLSFEDAIEAESDRLAGEAEKIMADPNYSTFTHVHYSYLTRGRYIEQLPRWLERFPRDRMLILASEDLSREPAAAFQRALDFLGLDAWTPGQFNIFKQGSYEQMNPSTRAKLVEYFRPYNQQLYDLLEMKFDWDK